MVGLADIPEEEKKLLSEIAKSKGQSLEDTLAELGHGLKPIPESEIVVQFKGEPEITPKVAAEVSLPPPGATEVPPPPPASEEPKEAEVKEKELLSTVNHLCNQCGWDQEMPTIPEPEHKDKVGFLHALLGQKVFSKTYSLFGGYLEVTLRALTVGELDALYQEAYVAQTAGMFATTAEYYDHINQNRLCLQLIGLSSKKSALHLRLPEGLSKESHANAATYWTDLFPFAEHKTLPATTAAIEKEEEEIRSRDTDAYPAIATAEYAKQRAANASLLGQIRQYVQQKVLVTEQSHRVTAHTCNKFNRFMVKLEVNVDNENFWKETELQF